MDKFGQDSVEDVPRVVIADAAALAEIEDGLPPIEALSESDMWVYAFQPYDDADVILSDLPEKVRALARHAATGPMTDYSPCYWDPADLPAIREALVAEGWKVIDTEFYEVWS